MGPQSPPDFAASASHASQLVTTLAAQGRGRLKVPQLFPFEIR